MRLDEPRVGAKERAEWDDADKVIMKPFVDSDSDHNVFKTLLRHPSLFKRWLVFANHVLFKSTLPLRDKELVILRVGHRCRSGYEWAQHEAIGRRAGLDDSAVQSAIEGPAMAGASGLDQCLLLATDELLDDAFISDSTWRNLNTYLNQKQIVDLIFTVGQYNLVSMALNSLGVQLDDGLSPGNFSPE